LPRFFFTVLNNLTSPRRVTFLGHPTLGMFSTLPVLLHFFQIERIVDSGICNNFTISQFLCPSRFKSTTSCFRSSLSSLDLRPILKTRLFICKRVADDLKITLHIWGKFKRVIQDSLKLCSSFYYNEKHRWQFQLALPIAAIFLFSRILMRQHCTSSFKMRLLTFVLNALWEEACHIENGSSFHSFGPEYVKVFLKCLKFSFCLWDL
jgi:hypothetical protein